MMEWYHYLLSMLMLVFSIACILAGIFTAYFGSGKSRVVGAILLIIGLIAGVLFLWFVQVLPFLGDPFINLAGTTLFGISSVVGAILGAVVALGLFLLAIMKA
ncbi:MAG: hypothetical protein R6V50_07130 [Thermoplasmatota archaeon]